MTDQRPNILIMIPHDLGDTLGCYGHEAVPSPAIDQLAATGTRFANCFTPSPECSPSRACLFTSMLPHRNGMLGLANFGWHLRHPHLAQLLSQRGYDTHQFGFQHEIHGAIEDLGYQHVHPSPGSRVGPVCTDLCSFLREAAAGEDERAPWFACAGFFEVHRPFPALRDSAYDPDAVTVPPWLPDQPVVRRDLARFYQSIADLDAGVAAVSQTLQETGLDRDTLVIFTTDHGAAFPGAKATLYDPGVHVPLILHQPGRIAAGVVHDQLVSNMDVLPTLLELAGGPVPDDLDGRSFLPLLEGQPYQDREAVPLALFYDCSYDPMLAIRTATHKYIRSFAVDDAEAQGADPETRSTFAAGRWIRVNDFDVLTSPTWQALAPPEGSPRPPREELYDLINDPCERINLADEPGSQAVLADMRQRLAAMMEATDCPLLTGHVLPPPEQLGAGERHAPGGERFVATVAQRQALMT